MISKHLACVVIASTLLGTGAFLGCTQSTEDEVATEQAALKDPTTGEPTCDGKKVLVCHIPPGNPANAHEICVGAPAVAAHVRNHGDPVGPCPPSSPPPGTDAGTDTGTPPPEADTGTPPADGDGVIIR